jgi:hypothetical protein
VRAIANSGTPTPMEHWHLAREDTVAPATRRRLPGSQTLERNRTPQLNVSMTELSIRKTAVVSSASNVTYVDGSGHAANTASHVALGCKAAAIDATKTGQQ